MIHKKLDAIEELRSNIVVNSCKLKNEGELSESEIGAAFNDLVNLKHAYLKILANIQFKAP